MVKNFVRALVMSGIIAVLTTSTQAMGAGEQGERFDFQQGHQRIVGSWMGTLENGIRFVQSFSSEGITLADPLVDGVEGLRDDKASLAVASLVTAAPDLAHLPAGLAKANERRALSIHIDTARRSVRALFGAHECVSCDVIAIRSTHR